MRKIFNGSTCLLLSLLFYSCGDVQIKEQSLNGWDLKADLQNEKLSISHDSLGLILDNIQLQVSGDGVKNNLTGWKVKRTKDGLSIRTNTPENSSWTLSLMENRILVSSSTEGAYITAVAPAPLNRFPARIVDTAKVETVTTKKGMDYTGVNSEERHYVPEVNPQVMYLSLGLIDSPGLHSLFDKQTNTVIKFSPDSKLERLPEDQSLVQVTVTVGKEKELVGLITEYFTDILGMPSYVPLDDTYHKTAPTGWNHWLAFFRQVTEKDIVDHVDFISENLKSYGFEHCQLDDGYDHVDRRLWVKNWDPVTFPNGPEWLAKYIKSKGLIPGLWTVPYCYSVNDANPDWFIRDDEGKILMDYQGGGELDFTREDVINEYWIPMWKEFKRQGWEYHKFDMGNTSYMWHTYQHNFSDTTISAYEAANRTMKIWREIMGPEVWHTNHPDVDGGRTGFIDVAGCGRDPGVGWERMNNFFEVLSNNSYQNHIIWYSDPDCMVIRGKPTRADVGRRGSKTTPFLTFDEARTCASLLGLSGMQYLSGDDLLNLEDDRLDLIRKTIPTMPVFPVDMFGRSRDRGRYPEIVDLKVNQPSGIYDVIAVTNWKDKSALRTINLIQELSLESGQTYLVFDFWNETLKGTYEENFEIEIPAHGTQVFQIIKQKSHPQLIGNNRHISGAFGIKKNEWNDSQMTLSGISETVPGAKYSMYFYVPSGFRLADVNADVKDLQKELKSNGMLEISFTGDEKEVAWNLKFTGI